jgi:hypothetical protein
VSLHFYKDARKLRHNRKRISVIHLGRILGMTEAIHTALREGARLQIQSAALRLVEDLEPLVGQIGIDAEKAVGYEQ